MSTETATIVLDGDLTVRTASRIQSTLTEALAAERHVTLDCRAAERADLAFLQLVLAARRSAAVAGGVLRLIAPAGSAVAEAACRAGLAGPGSAGGAADDAFWRDRPDGE